MMFKLRCLAFVLAVGLTACLFSRPGGLSAQAQDVAPAAVFLSRGLEVDPAGVAGLAATRSAEPTPVQTNLGAGLVINATFNANVTAPTQATILNAIAFYQNTFTNNITANIEFYNMADGLGSSITACYFVSYSTYRAALASHATSADDATALANTPSGTTNPVNGGSQLCVKPANGRAIGLNTPDISFAGTPCPTLTGSGCIGINVNLANTLGDLTAVVQHEIDEVLGLGSAIDASQAFMTRPWPEDLFRWASAGVRSYASNPSTMIPCVATPSAFFSINGGVTNLNQFNNCDNGGDYGDWITHTPSQVQDAFTNGSAAPSLTLSSSEVRALDVIGYNILSTKHRNQLTSN
jgi:hypothetical protein